MNVIIWIYAVAALASSLAAVLAWITKLWWAKEYTAAMNETVKAKEAEIELLKVEVQNLRELTPMRLREYFLSVKEQLEEYNDQLRKELETAQEQIKNKDSEIRDLINAFPGLFSGGPQQPESKLDSKVEARVHSLRATKEELQAKAHSLEQKLQEDQLQRQIFDDLIAWLGQAKSPRSNNF